jgi:HlyD family secretion protein
MDRIIQKKKWKSRYTFYALGGSLFVFVCVWLWVGTRSDAMKVSRKYQTVSQVKRDVFKDYIRISGQVIPIQVVQLSPEEGGIVRDIVLEEGAKVRKGDVILRLSNSNLDLQILNAEAELAEKQNLLRNTQITMQQDLLNNRTERISLDLDVQRKKRNFEQNRRLYEERLISRETYLQSREDYDLVCRKHDLIVQRLRQDSISRSVQMEQMEENLTNMQQNVIAVRGRREKLELRSAIDGELGLLDVELGQSIAAGEKVGQINDLSDFKIQSQLDEHYIDRVRTGLQAMFVRDGKTYQVSVRKVYPEVRGGKFRIDLVFVGEKPEKIRSGQTYDMNLELGAPKEAVIIPRGTFFQTTGGNWIFVLDKEGNRAYRRNIRIGRQNPQCYEVEEGLEPGEEVIISGYEAFKDKEMLILKD